MSDGAQIVLFCLALLVPVALVLGVVMYFGKRSASKARGSVSSSDSMTDISRGID